MTDLHDGLAVTVTVEYTTTPQAGPQPWLPAGFRPWRPGQRVLYAFCYRPECAAGPDEPHGGLVLCNKCAVIEERGAAYASDARAACGPVMRELAPGERSGWVCCHCAHGRDTR